VTALLERPAQTLEEACRNSLQKQKAPTGRRSV